MNKKLNKNNKLIGEKNVTYTSFSNRFMERLDFYLSFSFNKLWSIFFKGVFCISRNPMYVGWFLIYIGVGIACASWIFLLIAMVFIILQHILVITEERLCLEKFGNEYREYMTKTPKWIGIPESGKSD